MTFGNGLKWIAMAAAGLGLSGCVAAAPPGQVVYTDGYSDPYVSGPVYVGSGYDPYYTEYDPYYAPVYPVGAVGTSITYIDYDNGYRSDRRRGRYRDRDRRRDVRDNRRERRQARRGERREVLRDERRARRQDQPRRARNTRADRSERRAERSAPTRRSERRRPVPSTVRQTYDNLQMEGDLPPVLRLDGE